MSYQNPTGDVTERETELLAAHDSGLNDSQIAEKFGYASDRSAGNAVRVALRKVDRGGEIKSSRGGGGTRAAKPVTIADLLAQTEAQLKVMQERLNNLPDPDAKPAELVKAHTAELESAVKRASDKLDAFRQMGKPERDAWVTEQRERIKSSASETRTSLEAGIEQTQVSIDALRIAAERVAA